MIRKSSSYFTKDGRPISFVWQEKGTAARGNTYWQEKGYNLHKLEAVVDGKIVGYLRIVYVSKQNARKFYPTIWHWMARNGEIPEDWLNHQEDRDLLYKYVIFNFSYDKEVLSEIENIPNMGIQEYKEYEQEREKFLAKIKRQQSNTKQGYNHFLVSTVDVPKIDFISVDDNMRRQGIALSLYQEAAKKMAERGLSLYSGWAQLPGAAKAWEKMKELKFPVFPEGKRLRLDFTKRGSQQYQTKSGRSISFKWIEDDQKQPDERGWVVHKLEALVEGQDAGYLRISYIPKQTWDRIYPTFWHWYLRYKRNGHFFVKDQPERLDPKNRDSLISMVGMALGYSLGNYVSNIEESISSMTPQEYRVWVKEREKILEKFKKSQWKEYVKFKRNQVDRPIVDYIRVQEEFQRQGVALALYQEGAKRMAKKGLPLYASSLQQPEAAKAWEKMKTIKKIPIKSDTRGTMIDFTRKKAILQYILASAHE